MLERQDDGATPFRLQVLTDLPALRLAPSGLRPNALPLHNVRDRGPERTAEDRTLVAGHSAFVTLSAHALSETDKSHRKGLERFNLLDTWSRPQGPDFGGARRDRTDDLMLAKHALSQLSYGPVSRPAGAQIMVGLGGLEPPTSRLSSARSNQLSYKPGRKKKSTARLTRSNRAGRGASISLDQKERRRRRGPANAA